MSINEKNKKWFIVTVIVLLCSAFSPPKARAGTGWLEKQKIVASDGVASDYFGYSVSISGDYAIVGVPGDDDNGTDAGSAYIFKRDGTGWIQQQKITASDGTAGDSFGCSVSISGDLAIVGAYHDGDKGYWSGSAYIFRRDGNSYSWIQQAKLLAFDGGGLNEFGCSVSLSGDFAIIGASQSTSGTGMAYVFYDPNWVQQQKLLASDGAGGDQFGVSVSISGDYAIIGARRDYDKGYLSGSAYIFKRIDANWVQQQKLLASDGADEDWFGYSVSISGDYAIIGAGMDDDKGIDSGSAYIFKHIDANWVQQQKLTASDGVTLDNFGCSVSISGDLAIVGAYHDGDKGYWSGSAYIFRRDETGWVQQAKLLASDGAATDQFGVSVSISGRYAIVGAYCDDDKGSNSGSAYIFVPCASWLTADLSNDCFVNFVDIAILGNQWLQAPGVPSADIVPLPDGDGMVDFLDLATFADWWLYRTD